MNWEEMEAMLLYHSIHMESNQTRIEGIAGRVLTGRKKQPEGMKDFAVAGSRKYSRRYPRCGRSTEVEGWRRSLENGLIRDWIDWTGG